MTRQRKMMLLKCMHRLLLFPQVIRQQSMHFLRSMFFSPSKDTECMKSTHMHICNLSNYKTCFLLQLFPCLVALRSMRMWGWIKPLEPASPSGHLHPHHVALVNLSHSASSIKESRLTKLINRIYLYPLALQLPLVYIYTCLVIW